MSIAADSDSTRAPYVHYCPFCGWHRAAPSLTIVAHGCDGCGCALSSCDREEYERLAPTFADTPYERPRGRDGSGVLAAILVAVFLVPALGVKLGELVFLAPLLVFVFAAVDCAITARLGGQRRGVWVCLIAGAALAAGASLIAVISSVIGEADTGAYYLGAGGSAGLLAGLLALARRTVLGAALGRVVDGVLVSVVVVSAGLYFVGLKGFGRGEALLTLVFLANLVAASLAIVSASARRSRRHRRVAFALLGCALAAAAGDGIVAAGGAHQTGSHPSLVALCWTLAGFMMGAAAELERAPARQSDEERARRGRVWPRIVLPIACVLSFPAIALAMALLGGLTVTAEAYFGALFVATLVIAFGRQAYLLVDNTRAVARERRLRSEAVRRNQELEALTGLASTMTESLEETPIMERGLSVLHLAARSSSSALHARTADGLTEFAIAGDWQKERLWVADCRVPPEPGVQQRGGRVIARLPLSARGNEIGLVTLIRPASSPFGRQESDLLALLAGQLAIAIQNARDYRERLHQAIRDPLTGVYNRRFFYETLEKELHRAERYGSEVSIVLFDIDNFKAINDTLGHGAGDDVLRRVAEVVNAVLRPTDSFARLGGEEFGLLLPETNQLDALLVAERLRTAIARNSLLPDRRVTVSGGVSSCPKDAGELSALIDLADAALYWAKRNGKNLCAVAGEVTVEAHEERVDGTIAHLHAMVSAIDGQSLLTRDHSESVASYAVALGQAIGLGPERTVKLRRAALLHDIGKAAISRAILEKPSKLTEEELEQIKAHPAIGATMLGHSGLHEEARWVRHHHERIDGRGYPDGLAGEQIPLEARILHIAEAFEAMTSDRPYHQAVEVTQAVAELRRCAGTQFDADLVAALAELVGDRRLTILATTG